MTYTIHINGETRTVDADDDTPLLWVLRDVLDLKGSKFGCGDGKADPETPDRFRRAEVDLS